MSYYTHSQWNGSESSHWYPTEASSINHRPITYENGPRHYQPLNQPYYVQHSYNEPQSSGGSHGAVEQALPSAEPHPRSDTDVGVPENAPTE